MAGIGKGVVWYDSRIRAITTTIPEKAHALAASQAAGIGAKLIRSTYSGNLARDVSRPKTVGLMHRTAGSDLPHALIENSGGVIRARPGGRMLIRGRRGGGRSNVGGPIVASATEVRHRGKHYLEAIGAAFPRLFITQLKRLMPG